MSVAVATEWQMKNVYGALHQCKFFDGIPEEKYPNVLRCLQAKQATFPKNSTIQHIGEPSQMAGVVISGTVELAFWDENGNQVNINHISTGEVFGAALACLEQSPCPVQVKALTDCEILLLNFNSLLNMEEPVCPYRMRVATNLLRDFARQTLFLNQKLQMISQKRLRDKIKLYLRQQAFDKKGRVMLPFTRNEMADFLYVDRSALSRELGRMQQEGIISFQGQEFYILDKDFLES